VTISNFDKRVLIEQVRYMEEEHTLTCDVAEVSPDHAAHTEFEDRLWQRARCLVERYDLYSALGRAARLSRYAKTAALIVAALLGVFGVVYAVTDSHTINVYWLLLVLLGFNFISMLLWLIGISLNIESLTAGRLARLASWLPGHLENRTKSSTQADRAWLACNFAHGVGKWSFSTLSHQLWLVYLLFGLAYLVLLLMVRQYDFVWGTTLLSDAAFVRTTEVLSVPLEALGLATPSADQVQDTRIGLDQTLTAEHRNRWAQFLLGALLCFGIVPRTLLWCWSAIKCGYARRHFALDYYLPYYISLRQQLMPLASHGQIIDEDTSADVVAATPATTPVPHTLSDETRWIAVELDDNITWPPASITDGDDLGQVTDRESLARILQRLQSNQCPVVAVVVSSARAPDRGIQRTITSLMSNCVQRWLVLLQIQDHEPISTKRLAAWYRLAEACQVPADHVISMSTV
jgi:hypothetical protein